MSLDGKHILIGITGSIAAYKMPLLVRLLKKAGAEVQLILTDWAAKFVSPLTLETLSEQAVLSNFVESGKKWNSHIELGLWADLMLIAPATANTLAKMQSGQADNLLLATYLSARCPVMIAPAMDLDMYLHPTTQSNIRGLVAKGVELIAPRQGSLASGLTGPGRMEEPDEIFHLLRQHFDANQAFRSKKVLISAGPTYEQIDPVRFIGNRSSGKMGIALAQAFRKAGAQIHLVLGPVHPDLIPNAPEIQIIQVQTAAEMHEAITSRSEQADIIVMAAAVADFRPVKPYQQKIKKADGLEHIQLEPTVDILKQLGTQKRKGQLLIGFALETHDEMNEARKKLDSKNLDMVVMNSLADKGAGFESDTNRVSILTRGGEFKTTPLQSKTVIAQEILQEISKIASIS